MSYCGDCRVELPSDLELQVHTMEMGHHREMEKAGKARHECFGCQFACAPVEEYSEHVETDGHRRQLGRMRAFLDTQGDEEGALSRPPAREDQMGAYWAHPRQQDYPRNHSDYRPPSRRDSQAYDNYERPLREEGRRAAQRDGRWDGQHSQHMGRTPVITTSYSLHGRTPRTDTTNSSEYRKPGRPPGSTKKNAVVEKQKDKAVDKTPATPAKHKSSPKKKKIVMIAPAKKNWVRGLNAMHLQGSTRLDRSVDPNASDKAGSSASTPTPSSVIQAAGAPSGRPLRNNYLRNRTPLPHTQVSSVTANPAFTAPQSLPSNMPAQRLPVADATAQTGVLNQDVLSQTLNQINQLVGPQRAAPRTASVAPLPPVSQAPMVPALPAVTMSVASATVSKALVLPSPMDREREIGRLAIEENKLILNMQASMRQRNTINEEMQILDNELVTAVDDPRVTAGGESCEKMHELARLSIKFFKKRKELEMVLNDQQKLEFDLIRVGDQKKALLANDDPSA